MTGGRQQQQQQLSLRAVLDRIAALLSAHGVEWCGITIDTVPFPSPPATATTPSVSYCPHRPDRDRNRNDGTSVVPPPHTAAPVPAQAPAAANGCCTRAAVTGAHRLKLRIFTAADGGSTTSKVRQVQRRLELAEWMPREMVCVEFVGG